MLRIILAASIRFIIPTVTIYWILGKLGKKYPLLIKIRLAIFALSIPFWSVMTGIYYNDTFTQNIIENDGYGMSDVMHFMALEDDSVFDAVSSFATNNDGVYIGYNPMHDGIISGVIMITLTVTLFAFAIISYRKLKK